MLNTRLSVNAYIQYNTALNGIITNLRLRYNPKKEMTYVVFNEYKRISFVNCKSSVYSSGRDA
jgi:hypothetical protein